MRSEAIQQVASTITYKSPGRSKESLIGSWVGDKWDRQERETARSYAQFLVYRDLGPLRTFARAAEAMSLSRDRIKTVAANFNWTERAEAWDDYLAAVAREEAAAATREMVRAHVEVGLDLRLRGMRALASLTDDDLAVLAVKKPEAVIRMVEGGVKIEREARGLATDDDLTAGQNAELAGPRLARRMMLNPAAQALALAALDMLADQPDAEQTGPDDVLDVTSVDVPALPAAE